MTNSRLQKALAALFATTAMAAVSSQASATAIVGQITVDSSTGVNITTGSYTWDGGNIGYGPAGGADGTYATGQARVAGANPMNPLPGIKSQYLGWNHHISWRTFQIATAGGYTIAADRTSANNYQPAFSVFSSGSSPWDAFGTSHSFNQVKGPADSYINRVGTASGAAACDGGGTMCYMQTEAGHNDITGFVGYANSGAAFTNGEGDTVLGALSFGTSEKGALKNPALPYNGSSNPYTSVITKGSFIDAHAGAIAAPYAGVGSSVNTTDPTLSNAAGGGHADLMLWLEPGWYAIAAGGSCADFTCTPTAPVTGTAKLTIMANSAVTAPVPLPAAVWLLGSALAGMGLIGRRNKAAI